MTVEAPAPVPPPVPPVPPFNTFPAPAALPLNAIPAPVFNPAFAVPHAPVVKTVVETPAAVETEVVASPLFPPIPAPLVHSAPVVLDHNPFPNHAGAVQVAPTVIRNGHPIKPFVQF